MKHPILWLTFAYGLAGLPMTVADPPVPTPALLEFLAEFGQVDHATFDMLVEQNSGDRQESPNPANWGGNRDGVNSETNQQELSHEP